MKLGWVQIIKYAKNWVYIVRDLDPKKQETNLDCLLGDEIHAAKHPYQAHL